MDSEGDAVSGLGGGNGADDVARGSGSGLALELGGVSRRSAAMSVCFDRASVVMRCVSFWRS